LGDIGIDIDIDLCIVSMAPYFSEDPSPVSPSMDANAAIE